MRNMLRLPDVKQRLGLSEPTIYRHMKDGLLPKCVCVGPRAVAWPSDEIEAITSARVSGKDDAAIRALVKELTAARAAVAVAA